MAEFIAAAAWTNPPYSYTYHLISDLGVHGSSEAFGQFMYSPLVWVMNTGFFLFGLAVLAGVLLRGLPAGRRRLVVVTAALLAAGAILVALFPGSGEAFENGTAAYHGLGAFAGFTSGNALVILIGRAHRFLGVPRAPGRTLVLLVILGLVSTMAFVAVLPSGSDVLIGFFERGIIYPFLIGFIGVGAALRRHRSWSPQTGTPATNQPGPARRTPPTPRPRPPRRRRDNAGFEHPALHQPYRQQSSVEAHP